MASLPDQQNLFAYTPNLGFNIFASVAFAALAGGHGFWFVKYRRTRWIQALVCVFAISEMICYSLRSAASNDPYTAAYWVAQYILSLFSPMWLAIAMLLALMKAYKSSSDGLKAVFNRPKLITGLLIGYQALVGLLILIGALFVGNNRTVPGAYDYSGNSGIYVLLIGLGNQVGVLTLVQGLIVWTFISIKLSSSSPTVPLNPFADPQPFTLHPTSSSSSSLANASNPAISRILLERLFLTVGMLWVRAIFRLCEQSSPFYSVVQTSEPYFIIFDTMQIMVAATVWAAWPFGIMCEGVASGGVGQAEERRDIEDGNGK